MKKFLLYFFLLILTFVLVNIGTAKTYQPLKLMWEWPIIAQDLYSFDLDEDGFDELYIISYSEKDGKGWITGLNFSGHLVFEPWSVEGRLGEVVFKRPEKIKFIFVSDIDKDKNLDILADSEIIGGQVNYHILYRYERELEPGLFIKNIRKWYLDEASLITEILFEDFDSDQSTKEIIASSLDSKIYILTEEGKIKQKLQLEGGVWDIKLWDIDDDNRAELIAGHLNGITVIKGSNALWSFNSSERIFDIDVVKDNNTSTIFGVSENSLYALNSIGIKKFEKKFQEEEIKGITTFDVDNDSKEDILLISGKNIYAIDSDGDTKWTFFVGNFPRVIFSKDKKIFLGIGEEDKLYAFEQNFEYLRNELALRHLKRAKSFYEKNNCDNALNEAEIAREIFSEIENNEGLLESDNIIIHCSPSPDEEKEIKIANEYFSMGENNYNSGKMEEAKLYLEKAMEIYLKWGYRKEAIRADSLLLEINKKLTTEGKIKAQELYKKALEFFEEEDFENSTFYAKEALKLFSKINSTDGIFQSQQLLSKIERKKNEKLGEYYFERAKVSLKERDYENLSKYATMAKKFYEKLNNSEEKISTCNEFISLTKKYKKAQEYYEKARQLFNSGDYKNATLYAENAKELFLEIENEDGINKSESLLAEIKKKTEGFKLEIFYLMFIFGVILFIIIGILLMKKV